MTEDELRKACEDFLDAKPMSIPITEEPECVDATVVFAKRMQARGLLEAAEYFDGYNDDMGRFDQGLQNIIELCKTKAKEREG
jgi:hypothetical protein